MTKKTEVIDGAVNEDVVEIQPLSRIAKLKKNLSNVDRGFVVAAVTLTVASVGIAIAYRNSDSDASIEETITED